MNKRGWIRIVEAFVAVLLITGVVLIILNKGYVGKDISEKVYESERAILREIEINDGYRQKILTASNGQGDFSVDGGILSLINQRKPDYLYCDARICYVDSACGFDYPDEAEGKSIYAQSVVITATGNIYDPRQLKVFCWEK